MTGGDRVQKYRLASKKFGSSLSESFQSDQENKKY